MTANPVGILRGLFWFYYSLSILTDLEGPGQPTQEIATPRRNQWMDRQIHWGLFLPVLSFGLLFIVSILTLWYLNFVGEVWGKGFAFICSNKHYFNAQTNQDSIWNANVELPTLKQWVWDIWLSWHKSHSQTMHAFYKPTLHLLPPP